MSVLGLDFGTANLLVAVTQRGGVDILANEASSRLTAYVDDIHSLPTKDDLATPLKCSARPRFCRIAILAMPTRSTRRILVAN